MTRREAVDVILAGRKAARRAGKLYEPRKQNFIALGLPGDDFDLVTACADEIELARDRLLAAIDV